MKLHTEIKPRKDGTVKVAGADGKQYVFQREEDTGELACDIEDQATVAMLLNGGQFWPANEADHAAATALIEQSESEGEAEDDGEDEADMNALPIEAGTPPAPRRANNRKK